MNVAVNVIGYQEPGKVPSVLLALGVHILLAVFLFFGVRWQSRQADAVEVELWSSLPAVEKAAPPPEPIPVPKVEPKPEPKVEKAPEPVKPDIALEKKKEPKKEVKQEPPKRTEPNLKVDERKNIQAQLERETASLNQQLEKNRILDQMKREQAAGAARADAAYAGKIRAKIRSNIGLLPDIRGNPEAIFEVVQLPTGEILSVALRKSSGNKLFDDAVERAIRKSSPLPLPDRPDLFHRNLEIKYHPQD